MTRTVRTRTRPYRVTGQILRHYELIDSSQTFTGTINRTNTISDWHGRPVADGTLTSLQYRGDIRLSGYAIGENGYNLVRDKDTFAGYPIAPGASLNETPLAAPTGWYLDVVAGTNPSRPVVTPPELVQDLVELPKQILESWKFLKNPSIVLNGKQAANQYLNVKFGWLPFIEDLKHLMELQSEILKRSKEIQQLYSGRGLRRRLKFQDDTAHGVADFQWALYGTTSKVIVPVTTIVRKRSWGTIHWFPNALPPYHPSDHMWHNYVRNIVLGLTPEGMAKGLWNVIPWTWLIGWFTNFGKYALASSLTVPASHSGACFMSEVVVTMVPGVPRGVDCHEFKVTASGEFTATTKTRIVSGSLTPGFNMPLWDISKLSVLVALATQRIKR